MYTLLKLYYSLHILFDPLLQMQVPVPLARLERLGTFSGSLVCEQHEGEISQEATVPCIRHDISPLHSFIEHLLHSLVLLFNSAQRDPCHCPSNTTKLISLSFFLGLSTNLAA